MKRKTLLLLMCVIMTATVFAQNRMSGGILGGVNYSNINGKNDVDGGDGKFGFAAGLYLNFPVSDVFSISPSVLYSQMGAKFNFADSLGGDIKQRLSYLSVPIALKFNVGRGIALFAGPQFDFLLAGKLKDDQDNEIKNEDQFNQFDFALTGGAQLFTNSPVSLTVRYIHGLTNIVESSSATQTLAGTFHNRGVQATLNFRLWGGSKKAVAVTTPEVPAVLDSDSDGIPDNTDKCPNTPGVAKYEGCPVPDSDGDGINDDNDKCPNQAGVAKYQGCPVPDTDGDGINDDNDKCPSQAGTERYQGCPIPDTDGDGVNDEEDNCPKLAGTAANHGCPEVDASSQSKVDVMAKNIRWTTASGYTLATTSNKSLDQIASMLKADPNLKVTVSAHTDNKGDAEKNKTLSQSRADAVKDYLVKQGVDAAQIEATGYGGEQPIADNTTTAGRTKNKRVEVKLHY